MPLNHYFKYLNSRSVKMQNNDCTTQNRINYSQPIILQHFPLYRESDVGCVNKDFPINNDIFREKWEVLSKESTKLLGI